MTFTPRNAIPASVLSGVLAISGCTSDSGTIDLAPEPSWTEVATEPAWELDGYTIFGDVTSAGEVFVLHALDDEDELVALGVDAETGEVRWEYFATYSRTITGVEFEVDTSGTRAVFMQVTDLENDFEFPEITVVDADSGATEWTYPVGSVGSAPYFCGDDGEYVCLTAWVRGSGDDAGYQYIVLDAESGVPVSTTPLDDQRTLGTGLFNDDDGNLVHIDYEDGEQWRTSVSELFGSNDVDPDNGWSFELHEDGFYYGSLEVNPTTNEGDLYEVDYSLGAVAAFDQETGESIWIEAGTTICPTIELDEEAPVRCRTDGVLTFSDGEWSFEGSVSIEGFDPVTGETTWTWEADGLGEALYTESEAIFQVSETVYLFALPDGDVLIDLETGTTVSPEDQVPLWCSETEWVQPGRSINDDETYDARATENRWQCDYDGEATGEVVTVPDSAGETVGDYFAWIDDERLHAVRILGES